MSTQSALFGAVLTSSSVSTAPSCPATTTKCKSISVSASSNVQVHLWNIGALTLVGLSFAVTITGGTAGSRGVTVISCTVAWITSPLSCPGTTAAVLTNVTSGTYAVTAGVPKAPLAESFLLVAPYNALRHATTVSLSISACSSASSCSNSAKVRQIRAPIHTNA